MADKAPRHLAAQNRRARHDYFIAETVEAGIVLRGTEVKALRLGAASLAEAFAGEKNGELYLLNFHINDYPAANRMNHPHRRPRKLLVRRRERDRLLGSIKRDGITLVPLAVYFNQRGIAKAEIGLAKGKRKADKRQSIKDRDWQRQKARIMRDKG